MVIFNLDFTLAGYYSAAALVLFAAGRFAIPFFLIGLSPAHTHTHSLAHTSNLTLSLSLIHSLTLSFTLSLTLPLSLSPSLSHSLSLGASFKPKIYL